MADKVIMTERDAFGGSRIEDGTFSVDLWSDGVVIASAWSMRQREIAGELFTFRGTLVKHGTPGWNARGWTLREVDGQYVDTYPSRKAALVAVGRMVTLKAFRALNEAQKANGTAPVHTIGGREIGPDNPGAYGRTHDYTCPACVASGSSFTTSPRSETYWSS